MREVIQFIIVAGAVFWFVTWLRRAIRKSEAEKSGSLPPEAAASPPEGSARPTFGKARRQFTPQDQQGSAADALVSEWQRQAKESDDRRKAEFRAHAERPVPPITDEGRTAVERARREWLAIRHVFPPRLPQRSMSYFGGLPIVPDEFDWPTVHNREGLLERLNFMAQIDCSALPAGHCRDLFPDRGYLYFFAPLSNSMGPDANHFVCRYLPGPVAKDWEPLDMPATSPLEPADPIEAAWRGKRTHFDRVEVDLEWFSDPTDDEVAARSDEGHPFEVAKAIRAEKLDAFFGPPGQTDAMFSARRAPKDALWIPYDGFPLNWSTVRILERLVLAYHREEKADVAERIKALGTVPDDDPEAQRLRSLDSDLTNFSMKITRAFFNDARLGGHEAVPDEIKQQVRAFLEDLRVNGMPSSKERTYQHRALPMILNDWIAFAAVHGAEAGLLNKDAASLIPAEVVAALTQRHSARKHQMFGEGQVVQVAAEEMKDRYILLLQLGPDATLNWTVGEMGPLQYWITPEDLAARRFENTLLTIEAY